MTPRAGELAPVDAAGQLELTERHRAEDDGERPGRGRGGVRLRSRSARLRFGGAPAG